MSKWFNWPTEPDIILNNIDDVQQLDIISDTILVSRSDAEGNYSEYFPESHPTYAFPKCYGGMIAIIEGEAYWAVPSPIDGTPMTRIGDTRPGCKNYNHIVSFPFRREETISI